MEEFGEIINNKIYSATIETHNSCYVKTVLVFAKNEIEAHDKLVVYHNGDSKYEWRLTYTSKLKEVEVTSDVIQVGHGSSER